MSKKLRCLDLDQEFIESLRRHNLVTCKDVLNKSPVELMMMLKISIQSATDIIQKASETCKPALDLFKNLNFKSFLTTNLKPLDEILKGGIVYSSLTEIAGPSGCGKTQFCFMLTVNFLTFNNNEISKDNFPPNSNNLNETHHNNNEKNENIPQIAEANNDNVNISHESSKCNALKSVVYIDTEGAFDVDRLIEIAVSRYGNVYTNEQALLSLASRIYVFREKSLQNLLDRLDSLEEFIVRNNVGLIILDSVASLVRKEFNASLHNNIFERNKLLTKQASLLKYLASSFNIPAILTNQITTQFKKRNRIKVGEKMMQNDTSVKDTCMAEGSTFPSTPMTEDNRNSTVIALGTYWTHCINTRINLQYTESHGIRELCLIKCPQAPPLKLFFKINSGGLEIEGSPQFEHCAGTSVLTKSDFQWNA